MIRRLLALSVLLALPTGAFAQEEAPPQEAAASAPVTYNLNAAQSWLYVVVYKNPDTAAARFGHDHMMRASTFTGKVVWDAADASKCDISLSFAVKDLVPDPPGGRARAGLDAEGAVSDAQLATIKSNMLSKGQLDAASHPNITFQSTSCSGDGNGTAKVTGNLTVRGKSKSVTTTMKISADGTSFKASGTFKANHSDFGFKPFSAMLGALKNNEGLKFVVDVAGSK